FGGPCSCGCTGVPARDVRDEIVAISENSSAPAKSGSVVTPGTPDYIAKVRETYPRAYERWSGDEDAALRFFYELGSGVDALSSAHERQPSAIVARLTKLDLIDE